MVAVKVLDDADPIKEFVAHFLESDGRLDILEKYGIYTSLADLKNAKAGNFPYTFITPAGRVEYTYTLGDYTAKDNNVDCIALDNTPITTGALIRESSASLSFNARQAVPRGTVSDRLRRFVVVTDAPWNAKCDSVTDDSDAIQAALDYVGLNGGGCVVLPFSDTGQYRITKGLKMDSYTQLMGANPTRYPFNAGNKSALLADFTNQNQWVIEPKTTHNGGAFAYDELIAVKVGLGGGLPNGPTYNCSVKNLVINTKGKMPYGGIRMHGCPGSIIENVAVYNVGTGLLVNCCFGGKYSIHTLTAYFGVVAWDDINGNNFEIYAARHTDYTETVPDAYQLPTLKDTYLKLVSVHGLAKEDHYNRATGFMIGSTTTTSNTNVIEYVGERFTNGLFTLYAYSTHFTKFYIESDVNVTLTAIAGARSSLKIDAFHVYTSGSGEYFDTGFLQNMDITANGLTYAGSWGSFKPENNSYAIIRNRSLEEFGPSKPQYNVIYEKTGAWKAPILQNAWTTSTAPDYPVGFRKEKDRVCFRGSLSGGTAQVVAFVLPEGYRPASRVVTDKWIITSGGEFIPQVADPVHLALISFEA